MEFNSKIYIAGHDGLVGSAIIRRLKEAGYNNIIFRSIEELDLTRQSEVETFFEENKPEYVFLSAAKVGGIKANMEHPAEFYYINAMIANNIIHSAYRYNVKKLLFLGSSCIYPKFAKQPMTEDELLTGSLEKTNEAYAIAKISGLKMCDFYREQYGCNFISAMPTNLYGINDNFDLNTSHMLPAFIRKFHEAKINKDKTATIWGTGKPFREFLFVDDLADALFFLMLNYNEEGHVNVGTGIDYTILDYANTVKRIVGFKGEIVHDLMKPDGTPKKQLDISKIEKLGWKPSTKLEDGIKAVYSWYLEKI